MSITKFDARDARHPGERQPSGAPSPVSTAFADRFSVLAANLRRAIIGKDDVIDLALICLLAEGHLLIEDVPGVGKTSLARAIASSLGLSCGRIQFTPDLLPSDITGVSVYDQRTGAFEFRPGPIFAQVVVADEINRASPKSQSALLEVMEEGQVTVDGVMHRVRRPFLVVATQNPVDMDGTYPLPEAQLDRFCMQISVGYPDAAAEIAMLRARHGGRPAAPEPVLDEAVATEMIDQARSVFVSEALCAYAVAVVNATRAAPEVRLGASPRATLALVRAAQVRAAASRRDHVLPDDLKALAAPVLAHRLLLSSEGQLAAVRPNDLVERLVASTPIPTRPSS